jgi:rare lipoprotein A (peptidoglycan hydrolase)
MTRVKQAIAIFSCFFILWIAGCSMQPKRAVSVPSTTTTEKSIITFEGFASWYGKDFQGKKTANGERFNMNALTAAHLTLPFGTRVVVHYPATGKSVTVRINDRGPFSKKRVIDLSYAAAKAIGLVKAGHGWVDVRVVDHSQ